MDTIIVQAVYKKGVLKPRERLELPDNTVVQVEITPLTEVPKQGASLFGAFPELAVITLDDYTWSKGLWKKGLDKQSKIMDGSA